MKKRNHKPECVTLEQALWLACIAAGVGMLVCMLLCHTFIRCLLAAALVCVGIWRLRE